MRRIAKPKISKLTMKRIGVSAAIAVVILLAEYLIGNWFGFVFDDTATLSVLKKILPSAVSDEEVDAVFYNLGYDKQIATVISEEGDTIGLEAVTDRRILLRLLEIAEKADYAYLFIDLRFEKGIETEHDSILFAKIMSMPRIIVSTHEEKDGYSIADPELLKKAGYADYTTTYFSGFTKYSYLQNDSLSVALKMYMDLNGGDFKRYGPFFFSGGRLCRNLQFLKFRKDDVRKSDDSDDEDAGQEDLEVELPRYLSFGNVTLKYNSEDEISADMKDRIVVVGDMIHDIHQTYAGDVPGPLLNIRAYEALIERRHLLDWRLAVFLFVVYFGCSYFILYGHSIRCPEGVKNWLFRHPLVAFVLLNIGWGLVMFIVKLIAFIIFGVSVIIAIPTFVFSLISMPDGYSEFKEKNKINFKHNQRNTTSNE